MVDFSFVVCLCHCFVQRYAVVDTNRCYHRILHLPRVSLNIVAYVVAAVCVELFVVYRNGCNDN